MTELGLVTSLAIAWLAFWLDRPILLPLLAVSCFAASLLLREVDR